MAHTLNLFWTRGTAVVVCAVAGVTLSFAGYLAAVVGWDRPNAARQLQLLGENRVLMLQQTLDGFQKLVDASADQFTPPMGSSDRESFLRTTDQLRRHFAQSAMVGWAPRVWRLGRTAHELDARREGLPRYRIRDIEVDGGTVMAAEREEYLPLLYVDGNAADAPAVGTDLSSSIVVRDAIERAVQGGASAISGSFRFQTAGGTRTANVLVQPVYFVDLPMLTAAQRRAALAGVVAGFAEPGVLLERTLKAVKSPQGLNIYLYEDNDPRTLPLFVRTSLLSAQPAPVLTRAQVESGPHWTGQVRLADAHWTAVVVPNADAPFLTASNRAWLVLIIGCVLTGVVTLYIAIVDRMVQDLHATRDRLVFSHVVMNAAMEASPDGILIVDRDLKPLSYNHAFAGLFRVPVQEPDTPADETLLDLVDTHLKMPFRFSVHAHTACAGTKEVAQDDIELLDGRTFVRRSAPLESRAKGCVGRIWFFSDVTEERRTQRRLLDLVCVDSLTGLANRRTFAERLGQQCVLTKRTGLGFSVLFLDLDHFKEVNDSLGHAAGDRVLKEVGHRLRSTLRETDLIARFGGDEFAVLLPGAGDATSAGVVAAGICARLAAPYGVDGTVASVTASVGICTYSCEAGTPDEMLEHADKALYAAKRLGRNRYCFYTPGGDMDDDVITDCIDVVPLPARRLSAARSGPPTVEPTQAALET